MKIKERPRNDSRLKKTGRIYQQGATCGSRMDASARKDIIETTIET